MRIKGEWLISSQRTTLEYGEICLNTHERRVKQLQLLYSKICTFIGNQ